MRQSCRGQSLSYQKARRGWQRPTNDGLTQSGTGCFIAVPI